MKAPLSTGNTTDAPTRAGNSRLGRQTKLVAGWCLASSPDLARDCPQLGEEFRVADSRGCLDRENESRVNVAGIV